jgi:uncharacterized protein (DUF1501 family)
MRLDDELSRRRFLGRAAFAALGVGGLPILERAAAFAQDAKGGFPLRPATAKRVIYLYMEGGMSHLDTFDPKPGAAEMGPMKAIDTNVDGVKLGEHFVKLARQMDKVAVINSMNSNQGAHAQGQYLMHTSYPLRGTIKHPSMGAWLNLMAGKLNPTLPGHVAVGGGNHATAGFLESRYAPLPLGDPEAGLQNSARPAHVTAETFDRRLGRVRELNREFAAQNDTRKVRAYGDMIEEAVKLMSSKDLAAFDLKQEPEAMRAAYGATPFGQGCLLARRLVEHDVRFVEVTYGGWDTHNQNFEELEEKCPVLDQALATLLEDLQARGLLKETLVVLATEFGRTPKVREERMGRDHYPKAFSCLLAGGGVKGGRKYGATDPTGQEVIEKELKVADFNATIAHALGLPLEHVVTSPSGRPFTVASKGRPATELF